MNDLNDKKLNKEEAEKVTGGSGINADDMHNYIGQTLKLSYGFTGQYIGKVHITDVDSNYKVSFYPADFETCKSLCSFCNRNWFPSLSRESNDAPNERILEINPRLYYTFKVNYDPRIMITTSMVKIILFNNI